MIRPRAAEGVAGCLAIAGWLVLALTPLPWLAGLLLLAALALGWRARQARQDEALRASDLALAMDLAQAKARADEHERE